MTDTAEPGVPDTPGRAGGERDFFQLQALHDKEVADLRAVVAQLMQQVEFLDQRQADQHVLQTQVAQLREANGNLVQATFGAQDRQASAEHAAHRQTDFLAKLAHELRNPLQPIVHAHALLENLCADQPEVSKLQAVIGRQAGHLTRLVNDLLDASRVSSGKITLDQRTLSLQEVLAVAIEGSQGLFNGRHQYLDTRLPQEDVRLHGDPVRLAQVFTNLLHNASKFSPENETITLFSHVQGKTVQVTVRDRGMGIAAELQPFIFDMFTQGLRALDRAQGGLGLGLTLVRTLVELHGGTVQASSAGVGLGSEFTVLLPLDMDRAPQPQAHRPAATSKRAGRILLVEDNLDANETLRHLLELHGHYVTPRYDGITAVASATALHYDLIICDLGLPGMDGYAVAERIRAKPEGAVPSPAPYVIAMSGYNQPQDRARAMRSGFNHYLVKPLDIDVLLALIALHIH